MAIRQDLDRLRRIIARLDNPHHEAGEEAPCLRIGVPAIDLHLARSGLGPGALHEIAGHGPDEEQGAAGAAFLALCLRHSAPSRPILWATTHTDLYPPGLAGLGLDPRRLILLAARREAEIRWALEEALRCVALAAVVGEAAEIDLTASRRLQLAAEKMGIPCFILRRWRSADLARRHRARPIAAATRWRIQPLPGDGGNGAGENIDKARWRVDLWRCRNGSPASWIVEVAHAALHSPAIAAVPVPVADALGDGLPGQAERLVRDRREAARAST